MKLLIKYSLFLILIGAFLGSSCGADKSQQHVEDAKFALDQRNWSSTISHAEAALDYDPSNVQAVLLLSAGYLGRTGFVVMEFGSVLADRAKKYDIFGAIHELMNKDTFNRADLNASLSVLKNNVTPLPGASHPLYFDYMFQRGMINFLTVYADTSYVAQESDDEDIDPTDITEAMADIAEEYLSDAEDELIAAGLGETDDLVMNLRETYCVLDTLSTADDDFDLSILQDMVHCQLAPDDGADLSDDDFISDDIDSCSDFYLTSCDDAGPIE